MLDAVNDFILAYCTGTTQSMLYRGWQNRMALPTTDTYIIFALENTERKGTNVGYWDKTGADKYHHKVLREYIYTIDFFSSNGDTILAWAQALNTVGWSGVATAFFKTNGSCSNAYTDDIEYIPYTDLNNQYIERYRVRLHLVKWEALDTVQDFADEVVISKLINIDQKRGN